MKTALVTGASRGIGRAIALELKNNGFIVLGTATSDKGAKDLKDMGITGYILDLNIQSSIAQNNIGARGILPLSFWGWLQSSWLWVVEVAPIHRRKTPRFRLLRLSLWCDLVCFGKHSMWIQELSHRGSPFRTFCSLLD